MFVFVCDTTVWDAVSRLKVRGSLEIGKTDLAERFWEGILRWQLVTLSSIPMLYISSSITPQWVDKYLIVDIGLDKPIKYMYYIFHV